MLSKTLRIATRQSPLALWQANHVRALLLSLWPELRIELVPMVTSGDRFLKDKLLAVGGKGLFVKELEEALLDNRADIAVHSMKDVPAQFPDGLILPTICVRHNPFDALLSVAFPNFTALPQGAVIGTSSLRRQSQLLALRPDLHVSPLRGNIHTRINKLNNGEFDAIVLAQAGLERMGMDHLIKQTLDTMMLPACGQGALGIECRSDDHGIQQLIAHLHDNNSAVCVQTERQVNGLLGGNCHVPLAVYCQHVDENNLTLQAMVASMDGKTILRDSQFGNKETAMELANQCAKALLAKGADALLDAVP